MQLFKELEITIILSFVMINSFLAKMIEQNIYGGKN